MTEQSRKKKTAPSQVLRGRQNRRGRPSGKVYPVRRPLRLSLLTDALLTYLCSKVEGSDASSIIREAIDQHVTNSPVFDRDEFMVILSSIAATLNDRPDDLLRLLGEAARLFQAPIGAISRELGVTLPASTTDSGEK